VALAEGAPDVLPPSGGLRGPVWDELVAEMEADEPTPRPGERLGRYELRGLLGVGAMGRVYRAFDPALAREVAIKALVDGRAAPPPEQLRRFEREARLLATLNHPNIAAIYGWELIDGAPCLVLELVEGRTLAERLRKGPLPQADAVGAALQLASALEEAHRKGVVHRDLKPSNVKLDPSGRVKVLDFGIAKALAQDDGDAPPPSAPTTGAGAVLGTAPYMSPEQVRAEPVDTRSDVWAFGCLLYEMLTGFRAFPGSSNGEVLAAILRDDPDWSSLPASTPDGLRRLLRRCLRRDRRQRLQDIGDARIELTELGEASEEPPVRRSVPRLALPVAGAALLAALGALALTRVAPQRLPPAAARLSLELPAHLALADDYSAPFAVSPDGMQLALLALQDDVSRLYLRRVDGVEAVPVPGTEGAWQPAFSADGRSLVFFAQRKLMKVPLAGGPAAALAETGANPRGASVAPDGTIVLAATQTAGLLRLDPGATRPRPLTQLDLARGEGSHRWPQVLPGGEWVLFTTGVDGAPFDDAHIDVVSLATGERRRLWSGAAHARYAAGRLFFAQAGRLFAAPFDLESLALGGAPQVVIDGIHDDPRNGGAHFAVAEQGPLVYGPAAPRTTETFLAWVDADGALARIGDTPRPFRQPRLSPDGRRVATRIGTEASSGLWLVDTATATLTRAAAGSSWYRPIWTPDGRAVTAAAEQEGRWQLVTLPLGSAAPGTVLFEGPNRVYPNAWSPDGRVLVFQERRPGTGWDLRSLPVGPDGRAAGPPRDLAASPFQEGGASISADGRFVAYESDELDSIFGVYVAPLSNPAARRRGSDSIVRSPRWGPGGRLYCWYPIGARPGESKAAEGLHRIDGAAEGVPGRSVPLWTDPRRAAPLLRRLTVTAYAGYDVDLSAQEPRFLVQETSAPSTEAPLQRPVVVLNWQRALAPAAR
jgi:serine/threonine-protein kinase